MNNITKAQAEDVIKHLKEEFDSHNFIKKYRKLYEKEYVELLIKYYKLNSGSNIYQSAHLEIGRFLSLNSEKLKIEKDDRGKSENDKGDNTENQKWKIVSFTEVGT